MVSRNKLGLGLVFVGLTLAGCVSVETFEQSIARHEKKCMAYGFYPGTDAMAKCIQREIRDERKEDAKHEKKHSYAAKHQYSSPRYVSTTSQVKRSQQAIQNNHVQVFELGGNANSSHNLSSVGYVSKSSNNGGPANNGFIGASSLKSDNSAGFKSSEDYDFQRAIEESKITANNEAMFRAQQEAAVAETMKAAESMATADAIIATPNLAIDQAQNDAQMAFGG